MHRNLSTGAIVVKQEGMVSLPPAGSTTSAPASAVRRLGALLVALLWLWPAIALGAGEGTVKWAVPMDGWELYPPAVGPDGTVYIGEHGGSLRAVNSDGSLKWIFSTSWGNTYPSAPALGPDGSVYVGLNRFSEFCDVGSFYALNPDGTEKWSSQTGQVHDSPAVGSDGTVYVPSCKGLTAFSPAGSVKWVLPYQAAGSLGIGADGTIYSAHGSVSAIDPEGTVKWTLRLPNLDSAQYLTLGPGGAVYVASIQTPAPYQTWLYAISPTGEIKWSYPGAQYSISAPVVDADGVIYFTLGYDRLIALDPGGTLRWTFPVLRTYGGSPVIGADGSIYVGGGNLYALRSDGTMQWSLDVRIPFGLTMGADGTVYGGSNFPGDEFVGGTLYAVSTTSNGPADSSWPMYGRNAWHTANANDSSLMPSAGTGGGISPRDTVVVGKGKSARFTITPSSGYVIEDVLVDGSSVGAVSAVTLTNVVANHRIEPLFAAKQPDTSTSQPGQPSQTGPTPGSASGDTTAPPASGGGSAAVLDSSTLSAGSSGGGGGGCVYDPMAWGGPEILAMIAAAAGLARKRGRHRRLLGSASPVPGR
jgi:hypothetical protein